QQGELEAPITSLIHPDDLNQVAASISKSMTTQEALMQSYRVKHKDGTWRWFEGSITNRLTDPAIGSIVMTFRDVTERKHSEDALRESEENFHSLFEDSPIAIWLEDFSQLKKYLDRLREQGITNIKNYLIEHPAELEQLSGMVKILEINKTSARILGAQTKAEVLKSLPDYFTKESLKVFADEIAALADGQTQFKSEIPVKDLYGKEVIFDLTLTVQPGSEEDLSRVLVSFLDVTEQKLSNAKLKESEERFRQLADNIHEVFWMFDRESQKHIYANPAYRSIFGIMEEDILLKRLIEIVLPEDRLILEAAIEKQINGEPTEAEYRIKWPDDSIHWIWDRSFPVYDEEGKLTRTAGIATDITLNKKAEEELKERESFLQSIVGGSPGYIVSHDIEGHFLYANRRWPEQSEEEFRSMKLQNMLHPNSLEPVMEAFRKAFVTRETQRVEQSVLTPNGDYHWFDVIYSPQVVNDEVKSVTAFAYDINDRKLAEIALRESEEKYRGLMESLDNIIATMDYDGRFFYVNDKAADALGNKTNEIIGKTVFDLFPDEVSASLMENIRIAIQEDRGVLMESKNLVRGEFRWYRTMIQPIHDVQGKVLHVLTNSTDIHDLKMAQHDLQELNNTLEERVQIRTAEVQDLYDNAPNGYHSLDADGALVMINQTELNWLGYTRHEVLGKMKFRDLLGSENSSMFDGIFSQFVTSGKIADQTLSLIRKDGSQLPVLLNAYAIYDEYGNFTTSRCTITDITERVKIENALRESRDQLSAANVSLEKAARLKDEFLASMSHELRTPLTGVLGLSEALQLNAYGELNEKQLRTVKAIEESGRHLLELINDILDLSKIEAGKLDMQFTSFSINDICQASLQLIKGMANQKRQNIHFTPPTKPIMLNADPRRIKQILVNLLSNAVKFTPEHGELGLVVEVNPADENISMAVWDKGIGIKTENIQKLFKPFTQIDSSLAREYSGTGLGLSLAHRLVELHGGRIELESVFGEGSRFTVILPWSDEEALSVYGELDAPSQSQSNKTGETNPSMIMVADDNETVLEMITDFLESKQYRVTKARSGAELIQKVPEILPDLILVDIQMPGMDGLETIRLIRSSSNPTIASVPIIAVTALAMPGDRERCLRAGATDYMSKPMKLNELAMLIQKRKRPQ
ncbi:MAG TPA: PAS domain S-box protein, partial [Anaerolineales bacterium]|nr:PAS domain S-box protein [Anaerolineales bacterium]